MNKSDFRKDLEQLINRHSMENGSDTPDFILADYLVDVMDSFNQGVNRRSQWNPPPEQPEPEGVTDEMFQWFVDCRRTSPGGVDTVYCPRNKCAAFQYNKVGGMKELRDAWIREHFPCRLVTFLRRARENAESWAASGLTREPMVKPDNVVLELFFAVFPSAICMNVVKIDESAIGIRRPFEPVVTKSPLYELVAGEPFARYNPDDWDELKTALSEFHGFDEAPVPSKVRIVENGVLKDWRVYVGNTVTDVDDRAITAFEGYFNQEIPIHTPTRLTGEWTRTVPKWFTLADLPEVIPIKTKHPNEKISGIVDPDLWGAVLEHLNTLQPEGIEVWRYKLSRENNERPVD